MIPRSYLKIGLGGVINFELMTFEFCSGEKLRPYLAKLIDEDSLYKYKREFVNADKTSYTKRMYNDRLMYAVSFKLQKFVVYEYKRFAGNSLGEIEEGYFIMLTNEIRELEKEEICHWLKNSETKEKSATYRLQKEIPSAEEIRVTLKPLPTKVEQLELFEKYDKFIREDIDF